MTAIVRNYLNWSPLTKMGIGGGIAASAAYAFSATNPLTLLAAVAIGQGIAWAPDLAKRCFRPTQPPQRPVRQPVQAMPPQNSIQVCSLARAFNAKIATDPVEDDEIIPAEFLYYVGKGEYYHLGNLALSLLSSDSRDSGGNRIFRDALGKIFSVDKLGLIEAQMGLYGGDLTNIWWHASEGPWAPSGYRSSHASKP